MNALPESIDPSVRVPLALDGRSPPSIQAPDTPTEPRSIYAARVAVPGDGPALCAYVSVNLAGAVARNAPPLLLLHSVNAAASAAEVRPIFDHFRSSRPVVALELPGFGSSQRGRQHYTPALMAESILRATDLLRQMGFDRPVDALALSVSCEFLARAAIDRPDAFRTLAFISPTGLESNRDELFSGGRTKDRPWLRRLLSSALGEPVFRLLVQPSVIRWFMQRVWGSRAIEEMLLNHDVEVARHTGARFGPAAFLSGALFTRGVADLYTRVSRPVWLAHGVRGVFSDFGGLGRLQTAAPWTLDVFGAGAMPHFEAARLFTRRYEAFLRSVDDLLRRRAAAHSSSPRKHAGHEAPVASTLES